MIWPFTQTKKETNDPILLFLRELYEGINGRDLSVNERESRNIQDTSLTYGELSYESFKIMLDIVKPQPNEIFYDLGCGVGKPVFMAALLANFSHCYGVEFLDSLYATCQKQNEHFQKRIKQHAEFSDRQCTIDFFHADLFQFDFSNADVIYCSATCFIGDHWQQLVELFDKTKPGTRIILTTKRLVDEQKYETLFSDFLPMSWGECTVNIHKRK